uniref:Uncharacterized protein n=1 Tax=Ixodes ricinus TaxID=34613 RepID=A0A6B0V4I7_IXORI
MHDDVSPLRREFKHTMCMIRDQKAAWEKHMQESRPHLSSVLTLSEILSSCVAAKLVASDLVSRYPDIRQRVMRKVENELLEEKAKLENTVKLLKRAQNMLSGACQKALHAYEEQRQGLRVEDICLRTETEPSIADMVEWVMDAERHFSSQYPFEALNLLRVSLQLLRHCCLNLGYSVCAREFLLENMSLGENFAAQKFAREWTDDESMLAVLNEMLCTASFLMEAKD